MFDPYTIYVAPNPSIMTGPGTNTILLGHGDDGALVIDPAVDDPAFIDMLIHAGEERGGIRRIFLTHAHPDHVGGVEILRQKLGVPVFAGRSDVTYLDAILPDEARITIGNDVLRTIYTPGHRFDHVCFLLEGQRTLFAGDLVAGTGTIVIIPPEGDLSDYLFSLKRVYQLDVREIVPGHGPLIHEPQAKLQEYIDHRLQREQEILRVVRSYPLGVQRVEIVAQVYVGLAPALRDMAAASVLAHLLKLEHEAVVSHSEVDTWIPL